MLTKTDVPSRQAFVRWLTVCLVVLLSQSITAEVRADSRPLFLNPCGAGTGPGYWLAAADGGVFSFGGAQFYGSDVGGATNAASKVHQPPLSSVVGFASFGPDGYWLAEARGAVDSFSCAPNFGSASDVVLRAPIVGIEPTPDFAGYWLVAADGGVFTYGDAHFYGSIANLRLNRPIVGLAPTPDGHGYWLAGADGSIFSFGDARFLGSLGDFRLRAPIAAIGIPDTNQEGYWLVAEDGGVFSFGSAPFLGSLADTRLNAPIVGISTEPPRNPGCPARGSSGGPGYWLIGADGGVFSFGSAAFYGSTAGRKLAAHVIGMATTGSANC